MNTRDGSTKIEKLYDRIVTLRVARADHNAISTLIWRYQRVISCEFPLVALFD